MVAFLGIDLFRLSMLSSSPFPDWMHNYIEWNRIVGEEKSGRTIEGIEKNKGFGFALRTDFSLGYPES